MIGEDGKVRCDWCGFEDFTKEDILRLDLNMPFFTGPRLRITNDLCPGCTKKTLDALGNLELDIKTGLVT